MKANADSLRQWMGHLDEKKLLARVSRQVDPVYELAAVTKRLDGESAVIFNNVKGYSTPVVSNLCGSRELIAEALGTSVSGIIPRFIEAMRNPVPAVTVSPDQASVKEVVLTEDEIDLRSLLPAPVYHAKDGGPYITAGVLIARDPETGIRNLSIHRLQITGPRRLGILILPRHVAHFLRSTEKEGRPLEVAIVIGLDPFTLLASQAITSVGVDELEIAGALRGSPVPVVPCDTVRLEIPAEAEMVLEGRIQPHIREMEGPFGEFPKYYGPAGPKQVIEITRVTHRRSPIFQTILPAGREHLLLGAIPREATLLQMVRQAVPSVQGVHLTFGGTCRYHAVISIDKAHNGEAKNAALAAFSSSQEVKHVVVVDKDVDPFDLEAVEWAIATRFQADRDLFIVPDALCSKLDPSTEDGVGAKMALDATCPVGDTSDRFEKISIPGLEKVDVRDYLD